MAQLSTSEGRGRAGASALTVAALVAGLLVVGPAAGAATINVNCASQSLQGQINAAAGGSTLLITGTCIGNFSLTKSLTLEGNPAATLDGNDSGSVLSITGTHNVHLVGLTITGGLASSGAGINRQGGGTLTLNHVSVLRNLAIEAPAARGGGIYSIGGSLRLTASSVVENRALAEDPSDTHAEGGGIWSLGPLAIAGSTVESNRATAISFGGDASVHGGGVYQIGEAAGMTSTHLDGNHATATAAGGAAATGGALFMVADSSSLSIAKSTLSGNVLTARTVIGDAVASAQGGAAFAEVHSGTVSGSSLLGNRSVATSVGGLATVLGGALGAVVTTELVVTSTRIDGNRLAAFAAGEATAGGGGIFCSGPLTISSSSISNGSVAAVADSNAAEAHGGGIKTGGPLSVVRSTFDRNHVTASSNDAEATAQGGGIEADLAIHVASSTVSRNTVSSSTGSTLVAAALGGGLYALDQSQDRAITNSTIASNTATGSSPSGSGNTIARGGGITTETTLRLTDTTIARNRATGSGHSLTRQGGGLMVLFGAATLEATILALNTASSVGGPDCFGSVGSDGYNLLGRTAGCAFSAKPTDKLNKDPELGVLADNGGRTLTLALLAGSPALNAILPAACAVPIDQRGVSRPQGPKCDVGAYEKEQ
jgi:fibronectin-binding autotransporter adhesin